MMKKQTTTILLIIVFIVLDFFGIIFGNMLLNNNFVITDGEYTYDELFYSADDNKDYYRFKIMYFDGAVNSDSRNLFNDDLFRNVSFRAIDKNKAIVMLSCITKKSLLGYYSLSDKYMNEQELSEIYKKTDFVYSSELYDIFGKQYLYVSFKDFVHEKDDSYSDEDNFYLATKDYSESDALFEVVGLDMTEIKQGNKTHAQHSKALIDVFTQPYEYVTYLVQLVELVIIVLVYRKRKTK